MPDVKVYYVRGLEVCLTGGEEGLQDSTRRLVAIACFEHC